MSNVLVIVEKNIKNVVGNRMKKEKCRFCGEEAYTTHIKGEYYPLCFYHVKQWVSDFDSARENKPIPINHSSNPSVSSIDRPIS